MYAKDPREGKNAGVKHCNNPKAFTQYWSDVDDVYKNIDEHNPNKKLKILIVFDDMAADILSKRNFSPR